MKYLDLFYSVIGKIFAIGVGIYWYRSLQKPYVVIFYQIIFAFLAETAGTILVEYGKYNTWVFNVFILLELYLTSYAGLLLIPKKIHRYFYFSTGIVTVIWGIQVQPRHSIK